MTDIFIIIVLFVFSVLFFVFVFRAIIYIGLNVKLAAYALKIRLEFFNKKSTNLRETENDSMIHANNFLLNELNIFLKLPFSSYCKSGQLDKLNKSILKYRQSAELAHSTKFLKHLNYLMKTYSTTVLYNEVIKKKINKNSNSENKKMTSSKSASSFSETSNKTK